MRDVTRGKFRQNLKSVLTDCRTLFAGLISPTDNSNPPSRLTTSRSQRHRLQHPLLAVVVQHRLRTA